jgi:hypothetical protein
VIFQAVGEAISTSRASAIMKTKFIDAPGADQKDYHAVLSVSSVSGSEPIVQERPLIYNQSNGGNRCTGFHTFGAHTNGWGSLYHRQQPGPSIRSPSCLCDAMHIEMSGGSDKLVDAYDQRRSPQGRHTGKALDSTRDLKVE